MEYNKQKIRVLRDRSYTLENYSDVEAVLVGGVDGVFAVWREGDILCFAKGDDGFWKEVMRYHTHWGTAILNAIGICL